MDTNKIMLDELRIKIDSIDREILGLLKKRKEVVSEVGEFKRHHNMQPVQADRYKRILEALYVKADEFGISRDLVTQIWHAIHQDSVDQQDKQITSS